MRAVESAYTNVDVIGVSINAIP